MLPGRNADCLGASHLGSVGVGPHRLAIATQHHVGDAAVELDALLRAAAGVFLLLLWFHLGGLLLDLTGARERTVHLAAAAEAQHQMERRLLLDVVVAGRTKEKSKGFVRARATRLGLSAEVLPQSSPKGAAILELLAREDEALLIRGDALLVLDFLLHVLDSVGGLHIEGDGLTREGLHEDLHAYLAAKKNKGVRQRA